MMVDSSMFERFFSTIFHHQTATTPATALSRPLRQLELGDDTAMSSGVSPNRVRLFLAIVRVVLIAVVTAAAGPIAFIALAAPQLARRSTRSAGIALLPSALWVVCC